MNKSLSFKYFKCEYSKNLKMLLYMGVVGFVCYIIPLFSMEPNIHTKTTNVGLIITLFALACYIIPIFMNAYRYNKNLLIVIIHVQLVDLLCLMLTILLV